MVTMYDSTVPGDIPVNAPAVAGYPDLWPEASWARFQTGLRVRIARSAAQNDGHALDVEPTDATPAEAPGWAMRRLNATGWPAVALYVNRSNWQATYDACRGLPIRWWVATLDGSQSVSGPAPALAVQYAGEALSGGHYDLSVCDPAFFGGWFDMTPEQAQMLADVNQRTAELYNFIRYGVDGAGNHEYDRDRLAELMTAVQALQVPQAQLQPVLDAIAALKADLDGLTLKRA